MYNFPFITHINDVLPIVKDNDSFIIAERPWGTIFSYRLAGSDTFPAINSREDAIRRECRGITFCPKTGEITRRPFEKFFNIGEREETFLSNLNFQEPHTVFLKMDGSMVAPFESEKGNRNIRWGTKLGMSEVALQAEEWVSDQPKYQSFALWCIENDITPIFEFTTPSAQIVIRYPEPKLTLLAARHMQSGEYLDIVI